MVTEKLQLSNNTWTAYYGPKGTVAVPTNNKPISAFTFTQGTGTDSYRLNLDASGSRDGDGAIVKYSVDFGNGVAVDKATPDFLGFYYTKPGNYTIKLTTTDNLGAVSDPVTHAVTVVTPSNVKPVASFTFTQGTGSDSFRLNLDATGSAPVSDAAITKYTVNFGNNVSVDKTTPSFAGFYYTAAGTYIVTLTVTDSRGVISDPFSKTITVIAPNTPTVPAGTNGDNGINQTGVAGRQQTGTGITAYNAGGAGDFSTRINAAGGNISSLPAGTFTFSNFAYDGGGTEPTRFWFGAKITARGIYGAGSKSTVIQMNANTSTRKSDVPVQGTYQSNQLQYIFARVANFTVDGVKVQGTEQGHLYNGLRFDACSNPSLTNTTIAHIPGNAGSPPGETFGVNFQGCTGTVTVKNVTCDGAGVGAAVMGSNNSGATYNITNLYTFNHPYSAGWASWEHTGTMNFYNFQCYGARAFNAERIVGTVNFYDPIWSDPATQDLNPTYESGWTGGKINVYFSDNAAWQRFLAARSARKYVYPLTNASSVSLGVNKDTVKVYVAGVRQTSTSYIRWGGALA